MPMRAGGSGSASTRRVSVLESRIDPPERLLAWQRGDHRPELGPAFAPGEREAQRAQVAADGLELADELPRVGAAIGTVDELAEARQRLRRGQPRRLRRREDHVR